MQPLVSIILCTRDRAARLRDTLPSVLGQHYRPVEILAIDDGSTDETRAVLRHPDIQYHHQPPRGIAAARNAGLDLARGTRVIFHDDDDELPPAAIGVLSAALARHPRCVYAYGDWARPGQVARYTRTRARETVIEDGYEPVLTRHCGVLAHTMLFDRARAVGLRFDARDTCGEDIDFAARLARRGPIVHVPRVVSLYTRGHASLTSSSDAQGALAAMYQRHLAHVSPLTRTRLQRVIAACYPG